MATRATVSTRSVEAFAEVSDVTRKVMRANKSRDTGPEMIVRRLLHALGYRYRVHRSDLPGRPDLAFGPRRKAIFVHGCFWHAHIHPTCKIAGHPKTRYEFWQAKFARNRARDDRSLSALAERGWQALVIWECELRDIPALKVKLVRFLAVERDGLAKPADGWPCGLDGLGTSGDKGRGGECVV